jgi:predicted nucleic acid-binding Zn ribbon protein
VDGQQGSKFNWSRKFGSANVFQAHTMAKKSSPIESLGSILEQSLKRLDLRPRLDEYSVWPIWNDVVGPVIARNAQPEKIRNGTLFVKVSSPVWMQQLQFMKEMIAGKLNHRLKTETVKNIFFIIGRIDAPAAPAPQSETAEINIDQEFLQSIADPEIRGAFKKLLKSYSERKHKT